MTYTTNRRRFLVQIGAAVAGGLAAPMMFDLVNPSGLPFAWGTGEGDTLMPGSPICVHIALEGGNDYLNTLVPVEDSFYNSSSVGHGALALTPGETLALSGSSYRLHPSLTWLANRWNTTGDVGFVLGVGNMEQNFSHFDSRKYWETARLDTTGHIGWLGRYADVTRPQNALASVSMCDLRREALGATASTLVIADCADFSYATPWLNSNLFLNSAKQMAAISGGGMVADVAKMMNTTFDVADRIHGAVDPNITNGSANYARITRQLLQSAQLIRAGIPSQTYTMGFGDFDSHSGQREMQTARFNELNEGLTKFFAALAGHPREHDVFVLITSEFGRQGTLNKDLGTDHGQAGMAVFIGGGVARGVFGQAPTLDPGGPTSPNRCNDALKPTIDFRTVHATALTRLAKGDTNVADAALYAHYEDLGVFSPSTPPTTTTTIPPTTTTAPPPTTTTTRPTTTTTAPNKAPLASMYLSKTTGPMPLTVNASAAASTDADGTITKYQWKWGDLTASGTGKTATHKFLRRGTFTVQLTVTDNKGLTNAVTKTVKVT